MSIPQTVGRSLAHDHSLSLSLSLSLSVRIIELTQLMMPFLTFNIKIYIMLIYIMLVVMSLGLEGGPSLWQLILMNYSTSLVLTAQR